MIELRARVALLDIEGTLGSTAFVHTVLFPYARERMDTYVRAHASDPQVRALLDDAAREAGVASDDLGAIVGALNAWADADVKVTPLKALQGRIWVEGYEDAGIRGHLYPDAIEAIRRFYDGGVALYIYSSGSVPAQKLLFGNSIAGDLQPLLSGYFDTTIGLKRVRDSYARIAESIGEEPRHIVFFSDVEQELDAAKDAGMQTVQLARPQDGTPRSARHTVLETFADIALVAV